MVGLYVNNKRVDLFDDEAILVEAKVKNFLDIGSVSTPFTREFVVPASRNNNKIFSNFWMNELDAQDGKFTDYRLMQRASIELNGLPYLRGTLKILSINRKNNHTSSYKVFFTSHIRDIKDVLADKYISDLDWLDLAHENGEPQFVEPGLDNGQMLFDNKVIYPLITNNKNEWTVGSLQDGSINTQDLKPAVRFNEVVRRIASDNGFEFNFPLIDTPWFDRLYMWCPNKPEIDKTKVNYGTQFGSSQDIYYQDEAVDRWDRAETTITITPESAYNSVNYTINPLIGDSEDKLDTLFDTPHTGTGTQSMVFNKYSNPGDNYMGFFMKLNDNSKIIFDYTIETSYIQGTTEIDHFSESGTAIWIVEDVFNFAEFLPKIKQIDILSTLIKMYNLVIIPVDYNKFRFMTYDEWIAEGKLVDLSDKIDIADINVVVPSIPKKYIFEYKDPTAAGNEKFKELNGEAYGDEHAETKGDGESFEVTIGEFENMLWDRLDENEGYYVGKSVNGSSEDPTNLGSIRQPYLMYWSEGTSANIVLGDEGGGSDITISEYKMCDSYYTTTGTPEHTINFGAEINAFTTIVAPKYVNLYSQFYKNIVESTTNKHVRHYSLTGIVPYSRLINLGLNDVLRISDSYYRIDSYSYDTVTEKIHLNLTDYIEFKEIVGTTPPPDPEPPTAPTNLVVTNHVTTDCDLSWTASTDDTGIKNYLLYRNNELIATIPGSDTTYHINKLLSFTNTLYLIAVDDDNYQSPKSAEVDVVNGDIMPPDTIEDLGVAVYGEEANLVWTTPDDDSGSIDSYNIYVNNSLHDTIPALSPRYEHVLDPGRTYFYVTALDAEGNESYPSNEVEANYEENEYNIFGV